MSYNYLPLDRKRLHFQQVKNLLDYNQLVSITFDAHERILACSEWLEKHPKETNDYLRSAGESSLQLLVDNVEELGEEIPLEVVKLMLMLKIKSLSYGYSGVQIEIVKRLMEMYNNAMFPAVRAGGFEIGGSRSSLKQLALPLMGIGEVHFGGKIRKSLEVLTELQWQPLEITNLEAKSLTTGSQFITACGIFILKKTEQLLKVADIIAALSFEACGYTIDFNNEVFDSFENKEGKNTASIIAKFLESSDPKTNIDRQPYSFSSTPALHDVAKKAFDDASNTFLKEINTVSESPVIVSQKNLIVPNKNNRTASLCLALDLLSISMINLFHVAERRINHLAKNNKNIEAIHLAAANIVLENKQLAYPASVEYFYFDDIQDFAPAENWTCIKCLRVINHAEKMLALEMLAGATSNEMNGSIQHSFFLRQLLSDFKQQVQKSEKDLLQDDLLKTIDFIRQIK